ncbi:hypothetical protein JWG44_21425 [Leptospira sp. 201903071]|uniref:DUF5682 family protein n=1 Tax=Leptospira ainazelensis TaxID=2810034 RepID=UPI0019640283|nr:DUF5682 family protein [Leptospira ainazelensis]MBM9502818.1 hypothetical protein [Leptospira ainazelensis]
MNSIFFFPIRHHSVAASIALRKSIHELKPSVVLIEGPSDFNPKIRELYLPHTLPIAIYSFVRDGLGFSQSAYFPLCDYSPEWIALQTAKILGIPAFFIDLPWGDRCSIEDIPNNTVEPSNEYNPIQKEDLVEVLCKKMGVSGFPELWEELFEVDYRTQTYLERVSIFCNQLANFSDKTTRMREAFMAFQIRSAMTRFQGLTFVVTGGFHSSALRERMSKSPEPDELSWKERKEESYDHGIALTPYSNLRLESPNGSRIENPGFYDFVWESIQKNEYFDHRPLVRKIIMSLRKKGQTIGTADRIAFETMSRVLADLRGHKDLWRRDLIDGFRATLIKDEIARDVGHPLLDTISEVMRGNRIGRLAEGTSLPPIVSDIETTLIKFNILSEKETRTLELDLLQPEQKKQSRILHRLNLLKIAGYGLLKHTDTFSRKDHEDIKEEWKISMEADFHASCIEASRYGGTLSEASIGILNHRISSEMDLELATECLADAALAGLGKHLTFLLKRLLEMIPLESDFLKITSVLERIVHLYTYDEILKLEGRKGFEEIVREAYLRSLNLLDRLGVTSSEGLEQARGINTVIHTYEYFSESLALSPDEIEGVLSRAGAESEIDPFVRGAICGGRWKLNFGDTILDQLNSFYDSNRLGDFLSGLFLIARETVQRNKNLLTALNAKISELSYTEFLEALPALHSAFTFFTPREKHNIGISLFEIPQSKTILSLEDPETALRAVEFERILFETAFRYGIRTT